MELLTALGAARRPGDSGITDRAWARKKARGRGKCRPRRWPLLCPREGRGAVEIPLTALTAFGPARRPGDSGITDRAWAREKVKLLWEIQAAPRPMRATGRGKKLFTAEKSPLLRDDLEPVVVGQPGHKELFPT